MKKFIIFLLTPIFLFGTHGCPRIEDSQKGRDTFIRILTHENLDGVLIEIKGGYIVKNPSTDKKIDSSMFKNRCYLSSSVDGIKWGKIYKNTHQIQIIPKDDKTTFLLDGIQYRGKLSVFDISSKISLVIEIDADEYLRSILSGKFAYQAIHQTTLEALAISMRTNLYHKISTSTNPFWDIKSSDHDFRGSSMMLINPSVDAAITATKDLIMVYENRPFPTFWADHCGGRTAGYSTIFRKNVLCPPGVFVPFSQKSKDANKWKCAISKQEVATLAGLDKLESIEPYKCPTTGKIYGLKINGPHLTFREISFVDLQKKIGSHRLQSNDVDIKLIDQRVEFTGYGKGLGVGICLAAAKDMSKNGKSTSRMLSAFFPDTKIIKLEFVPQVFFEDSSL